MLPLGILKRHLSGSDWTPKHGAQTAITEMMSGVAETIPQSMQEQITTAFSSVDMSGAYSGVDFVGPFSNEFYEQMANADLSGAYTPLVENISTELPTQLSLIDYSGIGTQVGTGVGGAIQNTDMGPINSAITTLKGNTGTAIDTAFAPASIPQRQLLLRRITSWRIRQLQSVSLEAVPERQR